MEALAAVMPGAPLSEVLRRFERQDIFGSRSEWEAVMARGDLQVGLDVSMFPRLNDPLFGRSCRILCQHGLAESCM